MRKTQGSLHRKWKERGRKRTKMKVKTLINKLKKLPQDSVVIFVNTDMVNNGAYAVSTVSDWEDGTVVLDSNYKKNYWEGEE